jgi:hypothetical protein
MALENSGILVKVYRTYDIPKGYTPERFFYEFKFNETFDAFEVVEENVWALDELLKMGYTLETKKDSLIFKKETKETYHRRGHTITVDLKEGLFTGHAFNDDLFSSVYNSGPMSFTPELANILCVLIAQNKKEEKNEQY